MEQKVKYTHIRTLNNHDYSPSSRGGLTIAYLFDETANAIHYAVAKVHTKDHFCKETGRKLASERLLNKREGEHSGTITISQILERIDHNLNAVGIAKASVMDFNWYIITQTIKGIIVQDERFNRGLEYITWV